MEDFELQLKWQHKEGKGTMVDGSYERNAKAIDPETKLHQYVMTLRAGLMQWCHEYKLRMCKPPQVELMTIRENGSPEVLQRRAEKLHELMVDVGELGFRGKDFVIYLDPVRVESYGGLHIVLVSFVDNLPKREDLIELCKPLMDSFRS